MAYAEPFVSVVAPLHDEAAHLEESVACLVDVLARNYVNYEVILVDDCSADETAWLAEKLLHRHACLRLIRLSRRFGTDIAITAGLESVIGDYVVVLDLRHDPPTEIPALVGRGQAGASIVFGTCEQAGGRGRVGSLLRRLFFAGCARLFRMRLPANATNFLLLSRPAAAAVTRSMRRHRLLRLVACAVGYATACHPYAKLQGRQGAARRSPAALLGEAVSLIVSHTTSPLRMVAAFCAGVGCLNLVYVVYIAAIHLIKDRVAEGWTTLSLQIAAMFFLLFLALAVLSEYLGKTLEVSRGEPLYHVIEVKDSPHWPAEPGRRNVCEETGS